jgi:hypothetical protein
VTSSSAQRCRRRLGCAFAERVAQLTIAVGAASVRIVQVPASFLEKWDLANPPPEGSDLPGLLAAAEPWTPPDVRKPDLCRPALATDNAIERNNCLAAG